MFLYVNLPSTPSTFALSLVQNIVCQTIAVAIFNLLNKKSIDNVTTKAVSSSGMFYPFFMEKNCSSKCCK